MQNAAADLLYVFAEETAAGNADTTIILQRAFATLDIPVKMPRPVRGNAGDWVKQADAALLQLRDCTPRARQKLIQALMGIALHDGHISHPESELLRAFCALLDCPLPPVLDTP